jgi:hypothetical protein
VAKSGVRIKTNFNRRHTAIAAHMTKRVGEKFGYFIHGGNSEAKQRFGGTNLKDGGRSASTSGGQ